MNKKLIKNKDRLKKNYDTFLISALVFLIYTSSDLDSIFKLGKCTYIYSLYCLIILLSCFTSLIQ